MQQQVLAESAEYSRSRDLHNIYNLSPLLVREGNSKYLIELVENKPNVSYEVFVSFMASLLVSLFLTSTSDEKNLKIIFTST